MSNNFYVLKNKVIKQHLTEDIEAIKQIIKKAYLAHEHGKTIVPGSYFLNFLDSTPPSRIIALPGYIAEEFDVAGIKWISSNSKNLEKKLPRASAVIILNHADTGIPFACLEGSLISNARTAASAVLAAEYLNPKSRKFNNLGLIGIGPTAHEIYHYFIRSDWEIKKLTLFDLNASRCENFISSLEQNVTHTKTIANSVEDLVKNCDGIVFATTCTSPYLHKADLFQHNPLVLNISMRDLGPEILLKSHNVVDDITHVLSINTSPHLTQQQCGHSNFIDGTLGGLIKEKYKLSKHKPIIFSPIGLGILDLALSKYVFDKALVNNDLVQIDSFFGE